MDTPAAAKGGSTTKTVLIIAGSAIGVGLLAYLLFSKKTTPAATYVVGGVPATSTNPLSQALGGIGSLVGSLFNKPASATTVPPLVVSSWSNGTFNYTLGTMTGQITPTTQQGVPIKGANAGNYSLQINDYDGTGYDIILFNGSVQNSVYVTGSGSFSFLGRPGENRRFKRK